MVEEVTLYKCVSKGFSGALLVPKMRFEAVGWPLWAACSCGWQNLMECGVFLVSWTSSSTGPGRCWFPIPEQGVSLPGSS